MYTVISYGSESLVKTVLPPGKIHIKVMVSDRLSATNTATLEIEVNVLIFWRICFLVRRRQRRTV